MITFEQFTINYYSEGEKLPSGARYLENLALPPIDTSIITPDQARDYKIPVAEYRFIKRGAESLVYTDGNIMVKITADTHGYPPEKVLLHRYSKRKYSEQIENLPPLPIKVGEYFLPYWKYKEDGIKPEKGAVYSKALKGFAFIRELPFTSLNLKVLDNGVIVQDKMGDDHQDITRLDAKMIETHLKENGVINYDRNMKGNFYIGKNVIYVLD